MVYSYALGKAQTIIMSSTPSFRSSSQRCFWNSYNGRLQKLRALVTTSLGGLVVPSFQRQSPRTSSLHTASLLQTIARHTLEFMSVHALLCVVSFCHTGKLPTRAECKHCRVYVGTPRWLENDDTLQIVYFHLQVSYDSSVNIYATEAFLFYL